MERKSLTPPMQTVVYSSRVALYDAVHWINMDAISYEHGRKENYRIHESLYERCNYLGVRRTHRYEQNPRVHFTYALFRCELKSYKSLSSS